LSTERERLTQRYLDLLLLLGQHYRQLERRAARWLACRDGAAHRSAAEEAHVLLLECFAARGDARRRWASTNCCASAGT
jgi:hypothetical protein